MKNSPCGRRGHACRARYYILHTIYSVRLRYRNDMSLSTCFGTQLTLVVGSRRVSCYEQVIYYRCLMTYISERNV